MKLSPSRAQAAAAALISLPALVSLPAIVTLAALLTGCRRDVEPRVNPAEAVLVRRIEGAREIIADARRGPLVSYEQVLAMVDERLVQTLISAATPYERIVHDSYRVRVDSAAVEFQGGFALVRLDGRASLAQAPPDGVFADVSLYAGLNVIGLDPSSGVLRARLKIIAFTARRVGVLGMEPPARRLIEDLTRQELEEFDVFNSDIEIPLRFDETLKLPEVEAGDEDDRVHLDAAELPLQVSVQDVKVVGGKLWIPIGMAVLPGPAEPAGGPAGADSGAPGGKRSEAAPGRRAPEPGSAGRRSPRLAALDTIAPVGQGARRDSVNARVAKLRTTYQELQDSVAVLTASDSLLRRVASDSGDVALGVRPELLERLAGAVAAVYLDRVELDLTPEKPLNETEALKVKTPIGKIKAGDWSVQLGIHRLRGVLRAGAPQLTFTGADRIRLRLPVSILRGSGTGTIDFAWDAKSLVELVCDDFETRLDITGVVLPGSYDVRGDYVLAAEGEKILAQPDFPPDKFRLKVDLVPESWAKVQAVLESQNEAGKCGVVDVDDLTQKLKEVGRKGFNVKIPRSILKTVKIPAGLTESVDIQDRPIRLSVKPRALRASSSGLWYAAMVDVAVDAPSGGAPVPVDSSAEPER